MLKEIVEAGEPLLERRLGEVAQGFGDELAVLVEIFDALGDDAGIDAIDIDLAHLAARQRQRRVGLTVNDGLVPAWPVRQRLPVLPTRPQPLGRADTVVPTPFVNLPPL